MINFREMKQRYAENPLGILKQLVGAGRIESDDYVVLNPRRADKKAGSFRIDIATGRFHDFATGDSGGDIIDLAKFIYNCSTTEAVGKLSRFFSSLRGDTRVSQLPARRKKLDPTYIWSISKKSEDHEYLRRKRIAINNARVNIYQGRKQLIVPLVDSIPNDSIKGIQIIQEDGSKSFPQAFKGLFHVVSVGTSDNIVIAEGYATAVSIYEATKLFTVAAMAACNVITVAIKIRDQFPYSKIIIAADNDDPGRKAAEKTAQTLGNNVQIVYPTHGKDFNDMYKDCGANSVKLIFKNNGVINE